jgi:hypothetical protein
MGFHYRRGPFLIAGGVEPRIEGLSDEERLDLNFKLPALSDDQFHCEVRRSQDRGGVVVRVIATNGAVVVPVFFAALVVKRKTLLPDGAAAALRKVVDFIRAADSKWMHQTDAVKLELRPSELMNSEALHDRLTLLRKTIMLAATHLLSSVREAASAPVRVVSG